MSLYAVLCVASWNSGISSVYLLHFSILHLHFRAIQPHAACLLFSVPQVHREIYVTDVISQFFRMNH